MLVVDSDLPGFDVPGTQVFASLSRLLKATASPDPPLVPGTEKAQHGQEDGSRGYREERAIVAQRLPRSRLGR